MKRTIILLSVLLPITFSVKSQTDDSITGKWKFKDIYSAEKLDSGSLAMLRQMFADVTIYLKPNNHYKLFIMVKEEEGSWTFNDSSKKLTMTANKGTESEMEIISVTNKTLVLSLGKDKSFILEKTPPDEDDDIEEAINKPVLVSATAKQISKKWFICKREVPNRTAEQSKMVTDLVSGAYFDFKENNSYRSEIFKIKTDGKWQFGEENKSLILTVENDKLFWQIRSVGENELVLIRGNTEEVWTLCTKH